MENLISKNKKEALKKRMEELEIFEKDIHEKFIHSGGKGGQNVNKVATCVYLKHIPTGIEVKCQKDRHQESNRFFARRLLTSKIETKILGKLSQETKRIEKIRRQKRKRSKRSKEKMLKAKKENSQKKELRSFKPGVQDIAIIILIFLNLSVFSCFGDDLALSIAKDYDIGSKEEVSFTKAAPTKTIFTITNNSNKFIAIKKLDLKGGVKDMTNWCGSLPGKVNYEPILDVWDYDAMVKSTAQPIFVFGIIPPRKKIKVSYWTYFKESESWFDIEYYILEDDDLFKKFYFSLDEKKWFSYSKRFSHPKSIDSLTMTFDKMGSLQAVSPQLLDLESNKSSLMLSLQVIEPSLSFQEAQEKLNFYKEKRVLDYIYWNSEEAWIMQTRAGTYYITKNKHIEIGNVRTEVFLVIESSESMVAVILPLNGYSKFTPQKPTKDEYSYFDPGITLIKKSNILGLIEYANNRGDPISVIPYVDAFSQQDRCLLIGDFQESKRRQVTK